mmetsp:Transcript_38055/g.84738  ORF Transcript_38055/g.84738 Transcript_38055/m.84738 type:complete len:303 (-) Transcript_38055:516-1424(-)|eukprot:CAMPEP_0202902608 /NCGR_PEP_ID=MMETSP1392-20130828/16951_1 /ASSEMBLY_ACC=CAM_ASM_000868 /TAXON_ID=225041 /ORGANISM="Chlamydomonas chlamydogama, Strain SAG 11-48b" /LENGTH=302 /DNA_ID=CAMNT_0049589397 /DNA_START=153 /DNA_END=1061 /DNA_ORIENTATION=+
MAKRKKEAAAAEASAPEIQPSKKSKVLAPSDAAALQPSATDFKNKEKVLILSTRGITFRYRHLMNDLIQLLPHCKKDNKLDTKNDRGVINEVADMKSCTSVIFFEVRKKQDLYLWMAKAPSGPSVKFHVQNVHTMAELKLSGNHLKGSRPVISFDKSFDEQPHLQLLKEMLAQMFAVPKKHHKAKPFFDHVISFSVADNRIWMRNYQVVLPLDKKKADPGSASLVEVGPRMCLNPIKVFEGSFGGPTLYDNPAYVSPNAIRAAAKRAAGGKYKMKVQQKEKRKDHVSANPLPRDELEDVFKG